MNRGAKRWVLGVGTIVIGYAAWNAVLVGGHLYRHRDDANRLDYLVKQIEAERPEITRLEAELTTLQAALQQSEAEFTALGRWIDQVQSLYPQGVPDHMYAEYSANVDRYNGMVTAHNGKVEHFRTVQERYAAAVDRFNVHAEEANALAEEIGSIRDRLPLPMRRAERTR